MAFCNMCGAQIADGTTTCAVCAGRVATVPATTTTAVAGGMADNVAGMLAYITIIPAIIFLVMEPYNKNRFVRFHAWQYMFPACGRSCVLDSLVHRLCGAGVHPDSRAPRCVPPVACSLVALWSHGSSCSSRRIRDKCTSCQ